MVPEQILFSSLHRASSEKRKVHYASWHSATTLHFEGFFPHFAVIGPFFSFLSDRPKLLVMAASPAASVTVKFSAMCPKCRTSFPKPPRNWDCPQCNVKTWQPDELGLNCYCCAKPVAKFNRHHCRCCGFVTCGSCTQFTTVIADWSATEKHKVCRTCALPETEVTMSGYLQKLGQKHVFGEKFLKRFFELRGTNLTYSETEGTAGSKRLIDLEGARVMDAAMHSNAFCLVGPKLARGYIFSADTADEKTRWVQALSDALSGKTAGGGKGGAGGGGAGGLRTGLVGEDDEDDETTTDVVYDGSAAGGGSSRVVGINDFDLLTVIGLGSFGRVMKVRERRTGTIYAMKILDKQQILANRMVQHTQAEKDIMRTVDHPFVCKLHFAFQTRKHLVLVLTFLCGGELFFHLQRCGRFSESRAKFYAAEIGCALEYIHSQNIIYRDLKPENLVLDKDGHVCLTDFGLAKKDVADVTHTFCGTPEYMAPELILKRGHTKAVDWWSLGVFLYEMVAGLPPFYSQNVSEMYDMILNRALTFPKYFSPDLQNLLSRLLERDPARRLQQGDQFRAHPFFRDLDFAALLRKEVKPEFVPDFGGNDLKYFDKQFTQESVAMTGLDQPNDPSDQASKRFDGFDFAGVAPNGAGKGTASSPKGGTAGNRPAAPPAPVIDSIDL